MTLGAGGAKGAGLKREVGIQFVVFLLDDQRYALPMSAVERIIQAAEPTPLPNASPIVLGVIDVAGNVIPVLSLRYRFDLPERAIGAGDHFLIAHTAKRTVALVVDEVQRVLEHRETAIVPSARITRGIEHIPGILILDDGLVLIHDIDQCLSLDDERALESAMSAAVTGDF